MFVVKDNVDFQIRQALQINHAKFTVIWASVADFNKYAYAAPLGHFHIISTDLNKPISVDSWDLPT